MSSEACPRTLRYICACLQRDVQNRCGNVKKTLALVFMLVGGLKRGLSKLEQSQDSSFFGSSAPPYSIPDRFLKNSFSLHQNTPVWPSLFFFAINHSEYFQFGLLSEPVPPPAMRSLVMIAKCLQVKQIFVKKKQSHLVLLQNLANLVEFGGKEPYMEVRSNTAS